MKVLFTIAVVLTVNNVVVGQKSDQSKVILNYTEAIGRFISEKENINYPIGDTLVFFNLDSSVVDTIPKNIKKTHLKFISWEETQKILVTHDTIQALQIWITYFDDIRSFIFLPLKISKDDIQRDYEHMCGVAYYINRKKTTAEYKGMQCGSGLKMSD